MKDTIDFVSLSEQAAMEKLKEYNIALSFDEILKIQKEILKRPPTLTECILWSIQGSEHSSYKSSRMHLKKLPTEGKNVILGPSEDAGIVEVCRDYAGHKYGVVISHESHNHPSQIVPYEGAATGVGGNMRDVACMGAKVIAMADPLRFGAIGSNKTKWIQDGVVEGVSGYANPVGIPNIAGDVYYDESYNENCLVNVVTLGVLREDEIIHSRAPENSAGYNLILVGKPTDRSGFGGASFASIEMNEDDKEKNKGAVQEPNAFLKRHLLKATYELYKILKEKKLLHLVGFKDLGAGGVACASVEMADIVGLGAEVNVDLIHTGMKDLHPSIILCGETQERFMWVAAPEITDLILTHYNKTFDLPKVSEGAMASVVGKIRGDDQYIVTYHGEEIVHANASDVTKGLLYDREYKNPNRLFEEPQIQCHPPDQSRGNDNVEDVFLQILSHPNVASREPIYEKYDKNVQGISVIEPGEADAGVMQPFLDDKHPSEIKKTGIALSVDQNPRYNKIDPYWGAINAVVESVRNVAAVGATPIAITDCLNFGNPEKPEQMWEFVEGVRGVTDACNGLNLPVVSGNVSLYNESNGNSIAPSPIIACLGRMDDVSKATTMHFKKTDSVILMIGQRKDECGGSIYYDLIGELGANVPKPDFIEVQSQINSLIKTIDEGLILSAHDISDGGIAVTLSEMSFRNEIGFSVDLSPPYARGSGHEILSRLNKDKLLFTETGGYVLEVSVINLNNVRSIFRNRGIEAYEIGKTIAEKRLNMNDVVDLNLEHAKKTWTNGLRNKL